MHQVFADLAYYGWGVEPSQFYIPVRENDTGRERGPRFTTNYGSICTRHRNLFRDLFTLSPTYVTCRPSSLPPTISFLHTISPFARTVAFRLGMDADGCIYPHFKIEASRGRFLVRSRLSFATHNTCLARELRFLTSRIGFDAWPIMKGGGRVDALRTESASNLYKFKQMGGFVTPVRVKGDIGRHHSENSNAGFKKQSVLLAEAAYHRLKLWPSTKRGLSLARAERLREECWEKFCELRNYFERRLPNEPKASAV